MCFYMVSLAGAIILKIAVANFANTRFVVGKYA